MTDMTSTEYLTLREAAVIYRVSVDTLRRRIAAGELTGYRFGKRLIRIDAGELAALMRPIRATR